MQSKSAILLLCTAVSFAAQPPPATYLDEITITATRLEQDVFSVPYTAHVLRREDFVQRQAVRTLADALGETPGVMLQRTGYGQASPYIRGFTGFRTLLLIDGIRLNNAVFREGPNQYWTTVDPLGLDQLEVVQGPSSVLYGSDAIGGTVQGLTFDPGEALPAGRLAGNLFYRYASAERSQGGHLALRTKA